MGKQKLGFTLGPISSGSKVGTLSILSHLCIPESNARRPQAYYFYSSYFALASGLVHKCFSPAWKAFPPCPDVLSIKVSAHGSPPQRTFCTTQSLFIILSDFSVFRAQINIWNDVCSFVLLDYYQSLLTRMDILWGLICLQFQCLELYLTCKWWINIHCRYKWYKWSYSFNHCIPFEEEVYWLFY